MIDREREREREREGERERDFLETISYGKSVLTDNQKSKAEILVEFNDVIARQIRRWSQH